MNYYIVRYINVTNNINVITVFNVQVVVQKQRKNIYVRMFKVLERKRERERERERGEERAMKT